MTSEENQIPVIGIDIDVSRPQEREMSSDTEELMKGADDLIAESSQGVVQIGDANDGEEQGEGGAEGQVEPEPMKEDDAAGQDDTIDGLCDRVATLGQDAPQPPAAPKAASHRYVILTDQFVSEVSYEYQGLLIEWIYIKPTIPANTMNEVFTILDDPTPKMVMVWCFNIYVWAKEYSQELFECLGRIRNRMMKPSIHYLVISDIPFAPQHAKAWTEISVINHYIRNLNLSLNQTPLILSKAFLKRVNHIPKMCVKANYWKEYVEGTGLGVTISDEGMDKVRRWCGGHFKEGMVGRVNHNTMMGKAEVPTKLQDSPGYKSKLMQGFLKAIGLYNPNTWNDRRSPRQPFNTGSAQNNLLKPRLPGVVKRRWSNASSSSSGSKRSEYSRGSRASRPSVTYNQAEVDDKTKIVGLERDVQDLNNVIKTLKEAKEKEIEKHRVIVDQLYTRLDKLSYELELQARDRRCMEKKINKLKDDIRDVREDRDHYRREAEDRYKLATAIGDRRKS